jgi:hypothetical protein
LPKTDPRCTNDEGLILFDLMNGTNAGWRGGCRLGFPISQPVCLSASSRQKLEGHGPFELRVLGFIDDAHPPFADGLDDSVFSGEQFPSG